MNDKILDLLLKLGVLSYSHIEEIKKKLPPKGDVLTFLIKNGYLEEERFLQLVHRNFGLKIAKEINLSQIDEELLKKIPLEIIQNKRIIP